MGISLSDRPGEQSAEGRRNRRPWAAVLAVALFAGILVMPTIATAAVCASSATLSGSAFEIDTDANAKVDSTACLDWYDSSTTSKYLAGVQASNDKLSGSNDDAFGQGTSENDAVPNVVAGSIPPNKSDLSTFGLYSETATPKVLTLFWKRVQNPKGTTNMDFELNQKYCDTTKTPLPDDCSSNGITPDRTLGDKLITYDLSKGGTVPAISIREWDGSAWGTATVISGGANPQARGSVNTSTIATGDSPFGSADPFTFGEAAISYLALFPSGSTCRSLGSAYLKSRSSDSFSSEVKDFIAPEKVTVSNCSTIVTNATANGAVVGSGISDTATLGNVTSNAGGTITFIAYSDSTCSTQVASSTVPVSGNGNYTSGTYTATSPGTYYWIASYSGDPNNAAAAGLCGDPNESTTVIAASPSISTTPNPSSAEVGATLNDSALLSGGYNPGGTITFRLYGTADTTCSGAAIFTNTVNVSGNGSYSTSSGYTSTQAGTYHWIASYSGDGNNNPTAGACADETVTVARKQPGISTTPTPTSATITDALGDSASLSGGYNPTGTITFRLYAPSDATCTGTAVFTNTVNVSGNGSYSTSATFPSAAIGTYHWIASYSGDGNNFSVAGACADEPVVVSKAGSSVATAQKLYPQDSATVSATKGGTPSGSVTFSLYGPNDTNCSGAAVYTETANLDGTGKAATDNKTFSIDASTAGAYRWKVVYSGDGTHDGSTSSCGTENFNLTITNG